MGTSYPDRTNATGLWKLSDIYKNRMNLYQECANITLNTEDKSIYEIVEEISNHEKFSF